jgi:hypothetical protein
MTGLIVAVGACIGGMAFCLRFLFAVQLERRCGRACLVLCLTHKAAYQVFDRRQLRAAGSRRAA